MLKRLFPVLALLILAGCGSASTPTPTPTSVPTHTATAAPCPYPAINSNPWCYTFTDTGKMVYSPDATFCTYFVCSRDFFSGFGPIYECNDGIFLHVGDSAEAACADHSGVKQPLYMP